MLRLCYNAIFSYKKCYFYVVQKPLLLILFVFTTSIIFGQNSSANKTKTYGQDLSVGLRIHTSGWNIITDIAKRKSHTTHRLLHFSFGELTHSREKRQNPDAGFSTTARPFKFGKRNNLYTVNALIGKRKVIAQGAKENGVLIAWTYTGGLTLGLEKPYYLDLFDQANGIVRSEKYSPENETVFLTLFNIIGSSGFFTGISETKIIPGAHLQSGIQFDWSGESKSFQAVEVGTSIDVFSKTPEIMILEDNSPIFISVYAQFQLGKKW